MEDKMKKFTYTIEGTDGKVYGAGTSDKANESAAMDAMILHNPTDDTVIGVERDGTSWEFCVTVSNSDDYYISFKLA